MSVRRHAKRLRELFGVPALADEIGVSKSTVYRWFRSKRFTSEQSAAFKRVWADRAILATRALEPAYQALSSIKWLVDTGRLDRRNPVVAKAKREFKAALKLVRSVKRTPTLDPLRAHVGGELPGELARRLAGEWHTSVRAVYTMYHYL